MKTKPHILLATITVTMLLSTAALFASAPAEAGAPAVHNKTLLDLFIEGGWVMYPIAACSIFTFYLIGDCTMRTTLKKAAPAQHVEQVKNFFRQGDNVSAYNYCKANPSILTNVLRAGISLLGDGKHDVEEGIVAELGKENAKIQTWISYLSVIGVCTPMIGLVGTVTGMMKAFGSLATSGIGDPSSLSGAIGEVLVATASGLFIAIPAFGAFYYIRNRTMSVMHHIQDIISTLFRKMPYEALAGVHIGDEELYAAMPVWSNDSVAAEDTEDETPA